MADTSSTGGVMARATLVATAMQVLMVLIGHASPAIKAFFPVGGTTISAIAGVLFSLWGGAASAGQAATGGAVAGGGSALVGILVSYLLKDVDASTFAIGTGSSAVAGVIGAIVARMVTGQKSASS